MNLTLFDLNPPVDDGGVKMNDAQRRAITHGQGPLLVIAGAGTGKTRVITERIRHLLDSDAFAGRRKHSRADLHEESRRGNEVAGGKDLLASAAET